MSCARRGFGHYPKRTQKISDLYFLALSTKLRSNVPRLTILLEPQFLPNFAGRILSGSGASRLKLSASAESNKSVVWVDF